MSYPTTTLIVPMSLQENESLISMELTEAEELIPMSFSAPIQFIENVNYYDGAYSFTPSSAAQTIEIQDLTARQNITIEPIPSNYGRITYNGATLIVE